MGLFTFQTKLYTQEENLCPAWLKNMPYVSMTLTTLSISSGSLVQCILPRLKSLPLKHSGQ
jgi:hypothetical protein